MGLEVIRFLNSNQINEDLICIICKGVLEDPVWSQLCEHTFCKVCINEWLIRKTTCPNDRQPLQQSQLKPIPRFMRNVLGKLEIKCDFVSLGCYQTIKLETLREHVSVCNFNPEKRVECENGCGLTIKMADINDHNCVKELRKTVKSLIEENKRFDRVLNALKYDTNSLRNENIGLKEVTVNLQNDVKHIKQLIGFNEQLMSDANGVSFMSGMQTLSPTLTPMTTSTPMERNGHNSRLVPNPCVLITPLRMSSIMGTSEEPSSSTVLSTTRRVMNGSERQFRRRSNAMRVMPSLRTIPSMQMNGRYSPHYSNGTHSPPNMPQIQRIPAFIESNNNETIPTILDIDCLTDEEQDSDQTQNEIDFVEMNQEFDVDLDD